MDMTSLVLILLEYLEQLSNLFIQLMTIVIYWDFCLLIISMIRMLSTMELSGLLCITGMRLKESIKGWRDQVTILIVMIIKLLKLVNNIND